MQVDLVESTHWTHIMTCMGVVAGSHNALGLVEKNAGKLYRVSWVEFIVRSTTSQNGLKPLRCELLSVDHLITVYNLIYVTV